MSTIGLETTGLMIFGAAASCVALYSNLYDITSKIEDKTNECYESDELKSALRTKFIVTLVLSCLTVVVGIGLAIYFKKQEQEKPMLIGSVILAGILGILYSIYLRYNKVTRSFKTIILVIALIIFTALGIMLK
uniref:Uncharacterized protein n=1 Tax=viral metagenome TaxID=1070528 RepID=A0A6C0LU59_9ZZZZ